jgi:hypothetical protein
MKMAIFCSAPSVSDIPMVPGCQDEIVLDWWLVATEPIVPIFACYIHIVYDVDGLIATYSTCLMIRNARNITFLLQTTYHVLKKIASTMLLL